MMTEVVAWKLFSSLAKDVIVRSLLKGNLSNISPVRLIPTSQ